MEENTYKRIISVMDKIKKGEHVTIVAFGGSITTGYNSEPKTEKSWASRVGSWWKSKAASCGGTITFLNEGVSGTDSVWGAVRAKKHIVENKADFVHLEFAMNDQWLEPKVRRRSYEGLLRQILKEKERAVLALFVNERGTAQPSLQYEQEPILDYYGVPHISWKESEQEELDGFVDWNEYFDGEEAIHPNNKGHERIAHFIIAFLEKLWATPACSEQNKIQATLPQPLTNLGYENPIFITSSDTVPIKSAGWKNESPLHPEWVEHGGAKCGWSTNTKGAELIVKVRGTSVNVLYAESDSFAPALAWVEGGKKVELECFNPIRKGYLGWASRELIAGKEEKDYTVHILYPDSPKTAGNRETNVSGIVVTQ